MSTSKYYREQGRITEKGETSFRTIDSTKDAPATVVYAIDKQLDDEVVFSHSQMERTRHATIGSGTRNADHITERIFPPVDETFDMALQVAKFVYKTLGACVTTGTSTGETGTVTSGGGTTTLLLSGGGAFTIDEFAGYMLVITSGDNSGNKYQIKSNDADEVTLDTTTPANIDADGYRIDGPPFTHTITEATTPPSFALHQELENDTDANSIRQDLLGCIMNTLEIRVETDGNAEQSVDFLGAKTVPSSDIARPTELDDVELIKWCGAITHTLTYNSINELANANPDSVRLEINNNAQLLNVIGDCYPDHPVFGERDYTLTINMYPEKKVLFDLQDTVIADFLTDLAYVLKLSTVGGSHMTPITDTVASGGGTTVLTLTGGGLTPDAHIDSYLVVTAGDNVGATYRITDNDATTVTLHVVTPSSIDGDSVEIKWPNDIKVTLDKLYVDDAPASFPSKDDHEYSGEYMFKLTGDGSGSFVSTDNLGVAHYEGSS
jgi:hypothetical protein